MCSKINVKSMIALLSVTTAGTLLNNQLKSVAFLIIAKILIKSILYTVLLNLIIAIKRNKMY